MKQQILLLIFIALSLPTLKAQTVAKQPEGWTDGSGGTIYTLAELRWLSETPKAWNENWELGANIDATETKYWNNGKGFSPIGNADNWITNLVFNGNGYCIYKLYINRPQEENIGFFGDLLIGDNQNNNEVEIKDLCLVDVDVTGKNYVGGIVGKTLNYDILNCYVSGKIKSTNYISGGIGGYIGKKSVVNCFSSCSVEGVETVGGLIGASPGSKISSCVSTGSVKGVIKVGGLIGTAGFSSVIKQSYSFGNVLGELKVGGLVGYLYYASINKCFSAENVNISGRISGGLVGYNEKGKISYSYSKSIISGTDTIGGLVGINNNATIRFSYNLGAVSGHSFIGGITGYSSSGSINQVYSTGKVEGDTIIGAIEGSSHSSMQDCYYDTVRTSINCATGIDNVHYDTAFGLNTIDFKYDTIFTNWDFDSIWVIDTLPELYDGYGRPYFQWQANHYDVTFGAAVNGSIAGLPLLPFYSEFDTLCIFAVPDIGHHFKYWKGTTGDSILATNPLIVTKSWADTNLTAVFSINTYTFTSETNGDGTVTVDKPEAQHGDTVRFTITPGEGHQLDSVYYNGLNVTDSLDNNILTIIGVRQNGKLRAWFSEPSALENTPVTGIKVYPNPADNYIAIEQTIPGQKAIIQLINCNGIQVLKQEIKGNGQIAIHHLPEGFYILKITGEGMHYSEKIIVK